MFYLCIIFLEGFGQNQYWLYILYEGGGRLSVERDVISLTIIQVPITFTFLTPPAAFNKCCHRVPAIPYSLLFSCPLKEQICGMSEF